MSLLTDLRRHPAFRRARFNLRGNRSAARVIIGIGQMHPVSHGRFEGFQARKIAHVQAWIFFACRAFIDRGVRTFGQEGVWTEEGSALRLNADVLHRWRMEIVSPSNVPVFLRNAASKWRRALHRGKMQRVQKEAMALNGVALLQIFHARVHFFPIEQRTVHGVMGVQITALQKEIAALEESKPYARARQKQGRGLTKEEYAAVVRRNGLVRAFNNILIHPQRDRGIFREILRNADGQPLTVFVLGNGHRRAQLRLAKDHLPPDVLFVWITPPQLWWWKAMAGWVGWILLIGLACIGVWIVSEPSWL